MSNRKTRDELRKEKEIEEARKRGTIPAEVDEEGRDINPHIPQYIKTVPWYYGIDKPTLKHQRPQEDKQKHFDDIHKVAQKGIIKGSGATRYRKGACQNCGSTTHEKKDCVYKPRRVGARFSGRDIAPDEYIPNEDSASFEGKRDRWATYDLRQHKKVIEEFEKVEREKRRLQAEKLRQEAEEKKKQQEAGKEGEDAESSSSDDDDEEEDDRDDLRYADSAEMAGSKVDTKRRITVRNLRIREDTAKYLLNLAPNSAHYDPKTRSMRANPLANRGARPEDLPYAGDNFVRYSGDVPKIAERQLFAWDASTQGSDLHMQADPTKAELMHKQFKVKKNAFQDEQRVNILDKYGGEEHLKAPPKELLLAQSEHYVEYSQTGRVIKGKEKAKVLSRYEEDVYPGNHKSIWGSFWVDGRWGYACCHSTERNSYCTGEAGKRARQAKPTDLLAAKLKAQESTDGELNGEAQEKSLVDLHRDKLEQQEADRKKDKKKKKKKRSKKDEEDDESEEDEMEAHRKKEKRLLELIEKQKLLDAENERLLQMDERARPFNSARREDVSYQVTDEEMEAYRLSKQREEDPMAQFLSKA